MAYKGTIKPQHCARCSGNPGPSCDCPRRECPIKKGRSKFHSTSPQSQRPQNLTSQQLEFRAQQQQQSGQSSLPPAAGNCYNPRSASSSYALPPDLVASNSSLSSSLNSSFSCLLQTEQPPYYSSSPKDNPTLSPVVKTLATTAAHRERAPKENHTINPGTQQSFPATTTSKPTRLLDHDAATAAAAATAAKHSATKVFANECPQPYVPAQTIRRATKKRFRLSLLHQQH